MPCIGYFRSVIHSFRTKLWNGLIMYKTSSITARSTSISQSRSWILATLSLCDCIVWKPTWISGIFLDIKPANDSLRQSKSFKNSYFYSCLSLFFQINKECESSKTYVMDAATLYTDWSKSYLHFTQFSHQRISRSMRSIGIDWFIVPVSWGRLNAFKQQSPFKYFRLQVAMVLN